MKTPELSDGADRIRCISLWQPWAQWVMLGWKTIETRLHDRFKGLALERIGIHAAQKWDAFATKEALPFLTKEQLEATLRFTKHESALLGSVFVRDCSWLLPPAGKEALIECETRRFGLILQDPIQLHEPLAMKGGQGIFYATIPQ